MFRREWDGMENDTRSGTETGTPLRANPSSIPNLWETSAASLLLACSLAINLATYWWHYAVWTDEVMYTDPAVNFVLDKGFISTAWYHQSENAFWAGNVPLYQFLLVGWMKCFGFS